MLNLQKSVRTRRLKKIDWGRNFSIGIILILVIAAIFAKWISPFAPAEQNINLRLIPPFKNEYILGTDYLGRDILSQLIFGARVTLFIGAAGTICGFVFGTIVGLIAGFYGGRIDTIIMRLGDIQLAFPFTLLAISLMGVLGPSINNIIIVALITGWVKYARVTRAEVLAVKEQEYIHAGKAMGLSDARLLFRHILPNTIGSGLVVASLETGRIILMEAGLTFLGLGVPSTTPTWGTMLSEGRTYMLTSPWLAVFPGLAITLTVLAVNMLGDWLRNYLDPKN